MRLLPRGFLPSPSSIPCRTVSNLPKASHPLPPRILNFSHNLNPNPSTNHPRLPGTVFPGAGALCLGNLSPEGLPACAYPFPGPGFPRLRIIGFRIRNLNRIRKFFLKINLINYFIKKYFRLVFLKPLEKSHLILLILNIILIICL